MDFFPVMFFAMGGGSNPLTDFFAMLTRMFYVFFDSYGWAIIFLAIVMNGLMIPLNLRSQKSMTKQQAMSSKTAEIKRQYANDKAKQEEEMAKLMKEQGAGGMFGGCLLMILPMLIIIPLFAIVRAPMVHLTQVSTNDPNNLEAISVMLFEDGVITEAQKNQAPGYNIPIIQALENHPDALRKAVDNGWIKMGQMINMDFLGLDLSVTPSLSPGKLFGEERSTYLPLLAMGIFYLITSAAQMWLSAITRPNYKADKEAKALAKNNPARAEQVSKASSAGTSKGMLGFTVLMSLWFTFSQPSAMGMYWIAGNLVRLVQQVITYYLYTKPFELKKAEMAAIKSVAFTKGIKTAEQMALEVNQPKKKKNKKQVDEQPVIEVDEKKKPEGYQRQKRKK